MYCEHHTGAVVVWAPAKVNLFLEVLARRMDGYHEIETLMAAINLFDTLEFKEVSTGKVSLTCSNPRLPNGPDNLICRAAAVLQERTGCRKGAEIVLQKNIPMAAGLGGGSSDAAAALVGLNRVWDLGLENEDLASLGVEIGSDVPFFLTGQAAWCTGRGEKTTRIQMRKPLWLVLIKPAAGLSTAEVYRRVVVPKSPTNGERIRDAVAMGDADEIGRHLHNRLQSVAESLCPEVAEWNQQLRKCGPAGQLMSGSGTCVFAVCRSREEAVRVAQTIWGGAGEGKSPMVFLVRSSFELATE